MFGRCFEISPERWLIEGSIAEDDSTSHSKENMHHRCASGCISHLASGSNGSELVFPSLFVLFAFLEESLRDFDVLHDQRMNFRSLDLVSGFTVALGTLGEIETSAF
jgi:hypothetical protein